LWQDDAVSQVVIVDDCSNDDTVTQIDSWIKCHKTSASFDLLFIRNQKNEGTLSSIVKAVSNNRSDIVKLIGGDDFFVPGALRNIKNFFHEHCIDVLSTRVVPFVDTARGHQFVYDYGVSFREKKKGFFKLSASEQFKRLSLRNRIDAPGTVFRRGILDYLNLLRSKVRIVEDWPLWLILTKENTRIDFFDEITVFYRRHANQVTSSISESVARVSYIRDHVQIYEYLIIPHLKEFGRFERKIILDNYAYYRWKAGLLDSSESRLTFGLKHPTITLRKLAGLSTRILHPRLGEPFEFSKEGLKLAVTNFLE